jgi:hypothetical protein
VKKMQNVPQPTLQIPSSSLKAVPITAVLLMVVPIVFTLVFILLGTTFEYPDILRKPVAYVLERFASGGAGLIALWYGMFLSALAFIGIPLLTRRLFPKPSLLLDLGTVFGVLAGLVQALGFARWIFLVPTLAATQLDPNSSDATRAAIHVVFDAFNHYAGIGIGEHMGYLFTALWTLSICTALVSRSKWLSLSGAIFAIGILFGLLEPMGLGWAGIINALAYLAWSVWMIFFGITIWRSKPFYSQASS